MPDITKVTSQRLERELESALTKTQIPGLDWNKACNSALDNYRKYVIETIEKRMQTQKSTEHEAVKYARLKAIFFSGLSMAIIALAVFLGAHAGLNISSEETTNSQDWAFFGMFLSLLLSLCTIVVASAQISQWKKLCTINKPQKDVEQRLDLPCAITYQAEVKSSLSHPGGIVDIKHAYPVVDIYGKYIKKTTPLGSIALDEGGIEYTAHQFDFILSLLEKKENVHNAARTQILKSHGLSVDTQQAQQRIWQEVEAIRETNELNEDVLASLNEMAKYRRQERIEDAIISQAVQTG